MSEVDLALLVLRLTVGLLLAGHGAQKLFAWCGGCGLRATAGWLATMGLRPAILWALVAGVLELGGGLLFALGFLSPLGTLMIAASMLTAIAKVHWPRLWATTGGFELPLVNLAVVVAAGLAGGPGALALDSVYRTSLPPDAFLVGGGLVIVGWVFVIFNSTLSAVSESASAAGQSASQANNDPAHSTPRL